MERVYKTMRNVGAGNIAIGIIIAITGLQLELLPLSMGRCY